MVLAPGAAWATKRWAASHFRELAASWDGPVSVLGGPGEEALCAEVAGTSAEIVVERGFDRTIELLGRARVVVSGDTGLMHLGGACGARVVAVFGSTHPDDGFFCSPGEVVQRDLACRPCTLHGRQACPLGHLQCMDIGVTRVLEAVRRVWDGAS